MYRARDTTLDRDVALKVLPQAFTDDPDRLARFEREAKVLASLNHPNIGAIHGLEESEGIKALVLELVEGPTLTDRIAQGPIPVDEALPIAKQIAEALEAAHEAGIIHRDLKPANIKVREDGTVKVLDFGLAKGLDVTPQGDPNESPTLTAAGTQVGVIMGTAAYMSPEQARGKPVDRRADIWSFGVVLYEMLVGRRPFDGDDITLTLAEVVKSDPDLALLPAEVSPAIRHVLARCLQKDPKRRARDIGDVRLALDETEDAGLLGPMVPYQSGSVPESDAASPFSARAIALAVVLSIVVGAVTGLLVWQSAQSQPDQPLRLSVGTGTVVPSVVAVSPDGTTLVYSGLDETGARHLYERRLDQFETNRVPGTLGAEHPFFSPDGTEVGFAAEGTLMKVPLGGGGATTVTELEAVMRGGSWGDDGTIAFAQDGRGIWRVPAAGGASEQLTQLAEDETLHWAPELTRGSEQLLFTARVAGEDQLMVQSLAGGAPRRLGEGAIGRMTPTGHLIFEREGVLWATGVDLSAGTFTGDPVRLLEGLRPARWELPGFSVARGMGAVALLLPSTEFAELVWVDRSGRVEGIPGGGPIVAGHPRISPDGRHRHSPTRGRREPTPGAALRRAVRGRVVVA